MGLTHLDRARISVAIATPEIGDEAIVTASNEVGTLPAENVQLLIPFDRWRTESGEVTPYLEFDSSANPRPVSLVWVGYTNANASATLRVRAADSQANLTVAPKYDSGVQPHMRGPWSSWQRTHGYVQLGQPVTYPWWRIDFDNTGAAYYEAGRVYLCDPWVPTRGLDFQSRMQAEGNARKDRSLSGVGFAKGRGIYRRADFTLTSLDQDEFIDLAERIESRRKDAGDVLVLMDRNVPPRHMSKTLYAYFRALPEIQLRTRGVWRKSYDFEEVEYP